MNQGHEFSGRIDQVVSVRFRERPDPSAPSAVTTSDFFLYVRGWAVGSPEATFAIALDEEHPSLCATGFPRPDVADFLGLSEASNAGLDTFIALLALEGGPHRLALRAVDGQRIETLDVVTFHAEAKNVKSSSSRIQGRL